jgi:hypothetical protein
MKKIVGRMENVTINLTVRNFLRTRFNSIHVFQSLDLFGDTGRSRAMTVASILIAAVTAKLASSKLMLGEASSSMEQLLSWFWVVVFGL